jgi:hypothetical protein
MGDYSSDWDLMIDTREPDEIPDRYVFHSDQAESSNVARLWLVRVVQVWARHGSDISIEFLDGDGVEHVRLEGSIEHVNVRVSP